MTEKTPASNGIRIKSIEPIEGTPLDYWREATKGVKIPTFDEKTPAEIEIEKLEKEIEEGYFEHIKNPNRINELAQIIRKSKLEGLKQGIELGRKESEEEIETLRNSLKEILEINIYHINKGHELQQQFSNQKKEIIEKIFNKFDEYSCIKDDKWYLDYKKELIKQIEDAEKGRSEGQ